MPLPYHPLIKDPRLYSYARTHRDFLRNQLRGKTLVRAAVWYGMHRYYRGQQWRAVAKNKIGGDAVKGGLDDE